MIHEMAVGLSYEKQLGHAKDAITELKRGGVQWLKVQVGYPNSRTNYRYYIY